MGEQVLGLDIVLGLVSTCLQGNIGLDAAIIA